MYYKIFPSISDYTTGSQNIDFKISNPQKSQLRCIMTHYLLLVCSSKNKQRCAYSMLPPPCFSCRDDVLKVMSCIEFSTKPGVKARKLRFGLIRLENSFAHACHFMARMSKGQLCRISGLSCEQLLPAELWLSPAPSELSFDSLLFPFLTQSPAFATWRSRHRAAAVLIIISK